MPSAFQKIPSLHALALTVQSAPLVMGQLLVLAFAAVLVAALKHYLARTLRAAV